MKSLSFFFFCCAWCQLSFGASIVVRGPVLSNAAAGGGTTYTYDMVENFGGAGYDLAWTETGTPDENYTGDGDFTGDALRINPAAATWYTLGPNVGDLAQTTTCWKYKYTTQSAFVNYLEGLTAGGSTAWKLAHGPSAGTLQIQHGTTQNTTMSMTMSAGTLYYFWLEYEVGTGVNGVLRLFVSTTTTKPGSPTMSLTNGNGTANHGRIRVGSPSSATHEFIVDHIRRVASSTSVTDWAL